MRWVALSLAAAALLCSVSDCGDDAGDSASNVYHFKDAGEDQSAAGFAGGPIDGAGAQPSAGSANAGSGGAAGTSNGGSAGEEGGAAGSGGQAGTANGGTGDTAGAPSGGSGGDSDAGCPEGQTCGSPGAWGACAQSGANSCTGTQTRSTWICQNGACVQNSESQACNMPQGTSCGASWCCGPGQSNDPACGGLCGSPHYKKRCGSSGNCQDVCDYVACWSGGCGVGNVTQAACP